MPAIGGAAAWRGTSRTTAAAATARAATAAISRVLSRAFTECSFAARDPCRQHRQRAIKYHEAPQDGPVGEDVGEARVHLVDAHHAVDRRGAGKYQARPAHGGGNGPHGAWNADREKKAAGRPAGHK